MFNRDSLVSTARERINPSGGAYPDCEDSSDEDCCLALHQISYDQVSDDDDRRRAARSAAASSAAPGLRMRVCPATTSAWTTDRQRRELEPDSLCQRHVHLRRALQHRARFIDLTGTVQDGEACTVDTDCIGSSICFDNFCRPPGIECDACEREVDCDVGNTRAFGVFKCSMASASTSGRSTGARWPRVPQEHRLCEPDCATFAGDTGTNLLLRYCKGQLNGLLWNLQPGRRTTRSAFRWCRTTRRTLAALLGRSHGGVTAAVQHRVTRAPCAQCAMRLAFVPLVQAVQHPVHKRLPVLVRFCHTGGQVARTIPTRTLGADRSANGAGGDWCTAVRAAAECNSCASTARAQPTRLFKCFSRKAA